MHKTTLAHVRPAILTIALLNILSLGGAKPCLAQEDKDLSAFADRIAAAVQPWFAKKENLPHPDRRTSRRIDECPMGLVAR